MGATTHEGEGASEAQVQDTKVQRQGTHDRLGSVSSNFARLVIRSKSLLPSTRASRHSAFPRFFDLPAELRDAIYQHHWAGTTVALSGQPCTKHSDAILRTSRQLRHEALPVMFRLAALNVHLDRRFSNKHEYDLMYCYNYKTPSAPHFRGHVDLLTRFQSLHFRLDSPPKWLHAQSHWRRSAAAFVKTTRATVTPKTVASLSINIGNLDLRVESNRLLFDFVFNHFNTSWKCTPNKRVSADRYASNIDGPYELVADPSNPRESATIPEVTLGKVLKTMYGRKQLEALSRCSLIVWVGATAHDMKADLWLEKGNRRVLLHAETPLQLIRCAMSAGFCDGNDVWLKVGNYKRSAWP